MKNKFKLSIIMVPLLLSTGLLQTACMGSFKLLKMIYNWNEKATDIKIVNNVLFWILNIIPVYSIAVFLDAVIFNLVEFWTGSNPLAMQKGEVKEKYVLSPSGDMFRFRATQNRLEVFKNNSSEMSLDYRPGDKIWSATGSGKTIAIAKQISDEQIGFYAPDGSMQIVKMADLGNITMLQELKQKFQSSSAKAL